MNLLVHGIVEASSLGALASTGLTDMGRTGDVRTVGTVTHEDLAAVVTGTEELEAMPSRSNLLHHTDVLRSVGEHTTVVPMRFGVLVPDAEALIRDYLAPERDLLMASLRRLHGHVELRLRGTYDESAVIEAVLAADPRAARLRGRDNFDAKMELGERIVTGIARRREHDATRAMDALRAHATDAAPSEVAEPLDAFLLSFLVSADGRAPFEDRVDVLGHDLAPLLTLELAGPLPPFSFAAGQVQAWA